jgi:hypothetical protein
VVNESPQSAVGGQVFVLPALDGVFAGLDYYLAGQAKYPLGRADILDASD